MSAQNRPTTTNGKQKIKKMEKNEKLRAQSPWFTKWWENIISVCLYIYSFYLAFICSNSNCCVILIFYSSILYSFHFISFFSSSTFFFFFSFFAGPVAVFWFCKGPQTLAIHSRLSASCSSIRKQKRKTVEFNADKDPELRPNNYKKWIQNWYLFSRWIKKWKKERANAISWKRKIQTILLCKCYNMPVSRSIFYNGSVN